MKTNREVVSEAMHRLNALNVDQALSRRVVLSTLRDMASKVMKQRSDNRRLFQNMELYVSANVVLTPLGDDKRRSTKDFPERYDTTYGKILRVFSIDGKVEFIPTTEHEYQYTVNRKFKDPYKKYYYFKDNKLVVCDPDVEEVYISGIFKEPAKALLLDKAAVAPTCYFPLEDFFVCPQDLVGDVIDLTVQKYAGTIEVKAQEDENPDGNVLRR